MTEHVVEPSNQRTDVPNPPSWIDHLIAWVDRLPGPAWLFYILSVLAVGFLLNAGFWIDGGLPAGTFDPLFTNFAIFVVYWLGLYQYLTEVGSRSLRSFRPLLKADDAEIKRIDHELAILPRWLGRLAIPIGLGIAVADILGEPAQYGDLVPRTAFPYVVDVAVTGFLVATFWCLIIRTIRQLRMVRRLHKRATNISLMKLDSSHAFSALTARTGIGMILSLVLIFLYDPTEVAPGTTLDILSLSVLAIVATAAFVLPVIGMRDRLEEEKLRVLDETNDLLLAATEHLHNKLRSDNYQDIRDTKDAIEALIRERELIEKISTWPWDPRTLRGFASALMLPIFLWLVTRLLERFI